MANFNKVILLGNLTRDPQLSYLPTNQTPVVDFGMAMNRKWTAQDGNQREDTCFVDCRCFGRQAETINKYCSKGSPLLVEGRLTFDTWQAQDGSKRSKHRVTVMSFQFIGGGQRAGGGQGGQGGYGGQQADGGGGQGGYGGQQAGGGGQGGYGEQAPGPEMGGGQPPVGGPGDDVPF